MDTESTWKMIKKLNKIKVQISFFYSIIALIAIAIIGMILFFAFSNILIDQSLNQAKISTENSGSYINAYIDKIYGISRLIVNDSKLKDYIINQNDDQEDKILNDIKNVLAGDEFIKSIIIVTYDGRIISNEENLTMEMSNDMMETDWYQKATDAMPYLSSTRMNEFTMDKDSWVISISTEIVDESGSNLGVMLVDIDYQFVENHLFRMDSSEDTDVFIFDSGNCLVYHKDTSYFSDGEKRECLVDETIDNKEFDSKTNTATYRYNIEKADWTLTSVTKLTQLENMKNDLIKDIVLVSLLLIVLVVLASNMLAGRITRPINRLEKAMETDAGKIVDIEDGFASCDEVRSLTIHYNNMIQRVNELQLENIDKERRVRESEIEALTSQINPHFLYNTLDTILWMAEYKDTEGVVDMVKALGQFFRLSLSRGEPYVSIEDEIKHVKEYLYIQKKRYGEKLTYSFDLDKSIMDVKVPKIILQPIVENALYHGIKELDTPGHIKIKSTKEDGFIKFIISDNGVGFEVENLNEQSDKLKLSGVGIKNVDERLKLHYCDQCGVTIESKIGEGTVVTLRINIT
ncbi:MAG: sensor histidine kinase [Eubacteriales bacterium]